MKIIATKIKAKDLLPGDLFSTADQSYWDNRDKLAIGEKIYIRTEALTPQGQRNVEVYKIKIERRTKKR